MKACKRCKATKPNGEFYQRANRLHSECKRCTLDRQRELLTECACGCRTQTYGEYARGHRPLTETPRRGVSLPAITPSEVDVAWAAGFIEGEGHMRLNGSRRTQCTAMIKVSQVNREPLERLQRLFGGSIYSHDAKRRNPVSAWQVSGPLARSCLSAIALQLTSNRRHQAEDILAQVHRTSWAHVTRTPTSSSRA